MTALLQQHAIRPQVCGLGFGSGIQSVGALSLVRWLANEGDIV